MIYYGKTLSSSGPKLTAVQSYQYASQQDTGAAFKITFTASN